jgi:hypothetical protein
LQAVNSVLAAEKSENKEGVFDPKWLTREIFGFWGTFSGHFNLPAYQPWQQQIAGGAAGFIELFDEAGKRAAVIDLRHMRMR